MNTEERAGRRPVLRRPGDCVRVGSHDIIVDENIVYRSKAYQRSSAGIVRRILYYQIPKSPI